MNNEWGKNATAGWCAVLNLILAVVWLVLAAVLLALDYSSGKPVATIRGTNLSLGWLLLVLGLYNLARWWSIRSVERARRAREVPPSYRRHFTPRRDEPPDPNFDFTEEPPQEGPGSRP
jgi:hypothetical protein